MPGSVTSLGCCVYLISVDAEGREAGISIFLCASGPRSSQRDQDSRCSTTCTPKRVEPSLGVRYMILLSNLQKSVWLVDCRFGEEGFNGTLYLDSRVSLLRQLDLDCSVQVFRKTGQSHLQEQGSGVSKDKGMWQVLCSMPIPIRLNPLTWFYSDLDTRHLPCKTMS